MEGRVDAARGRCNAHLSMPPANDHAHGIPCQLDGCALLWKAISLRHPFIGAAMRLTQHTDYALRLLIALAVVACRMPDAGATVTIRDVAERYRISRNHLMKVANELTHLGLVEGLRGRGGGVRLAQPAKTISIGTVVRALETSSDLVECFSSRIGRMRHFPRLPFEGRARAGAGSIPVRPGRLHLGRCGQPARCARGPIKSRSRGQGRLKPPLARIEQRQRLCYGRTGAGSRKRD